MAVQVIHGQLGEADSPDGNARRYRDLERAKQVSLKEAEQGLCLAAKHAACDSARDCAGGSWPA